MLNNYHFNNKNQYRQRVVLDKILKPHYEKKYLFCKYVINYQQMKQFILQNNDCNFVSIFQEGKEIGNIQYIGVNPFPSIFDYFKIIKKGNLKTVNYYDEYLKDFNHKQEYTFDSNNYPITSTTSYCNNTSNSFTTYSYY